ncbi:MAG: tetratricopeptide repeat protein [Candidatus Melainabacteria bacterium]|nr:tetratricopeptide repeat protein [Candidatus Melainabacteria bacterium]
MILFFSKCTQSTCLAAAAAALLLAGAQASNALPEPGVEPESSALSALEKRGREYSNRRQWAKAQEVYRQILIKRQKQWGHDDVRLIGPLNDVVRVTCVDGKCADTMSYLRDLLSIRLKKFGHSNADVATTYALVAEANEKMQRYPEAIKNFLEAIKIRDRVFGKTAAISVRSRMNVIRVALKNKDKAQARAMLLECRTLLRAQRKPEPELEKLLSYYAGKI